MDLPLGAHHQLQALGAGLLLLLRQHVQGKVDEPALVENAGHVVLALGGDAGLGEAVQHIENILYRPQTPRHAIHPGFLHLLASRL